MHVNINTHTEIKVLVECMDRFCVLGRVCALVHGCACVWCVCVCGVCAVAAADPSLSYTPSVRLSRATRSLNVRSTHCEIAIKNVINKWSQKHFSKCLRRRTDRGTQLIKQTDRQRDTELIKQTDRQRDTELIKQTDRQTRLIKQTDRQTEGHRAN